MGLQSPFLSVDAPRTIVDVLISAVRISAWAAVLLFALPHAIFSREPDELGISTVRGAARVLVSAVVIVQVLALVGMLDLPAIIGSFILLRIGVRRRQRHDRRHTPGLGIGDRVQLAAYDILDANRSELQGRARRSAARVGRFLRKTIGANSVAFLRKHTVVTTVCAVVAVVYLRDAVAYPYPDTVREHAHLLRLKQLSAGAVLEGGYYPLGAHAFMEFLRGPTQLEPMLIWRLMALTCAVMTIVGVYALTRRFCAGDDCCSGGGTVAAVLTGFVAASSISGPISFTLEMHPMRLAAPVLIALLIGLCRIQDRERAWPPRWTLLPLGLLGFIHPVAWLVGAAALLGSALCDVAIRGSSPVVLVRSSAIVLASAIGPASLAVAAVLAGYGLADGALAVMAEVSYVAGAVNPIGVANAPLVLVGGAAASWLIVARTKATSCAAKNRAFVPAMAGLLGSAPLLMPHVGVAPPINVESLYGLLIPVASVNIGLAFDRLAGRAWHALGDKLSVFGRLPWQELPGVLATAAVFFFAPPNLKSADAHLEPGEVLDVVYEIKADFVPGEWTVVGHPELVTHTAGDSWTMTRAQFLERYSVANYRWHPEQPQNTIPTAHVFFVVEHDIPDLRGQTRTNRELRVAENTKLEAWVEAYAAEYGAPEVYYSSESVTVHHIVRSADEERAALQTAWEAAQPRQ